MSLPTKLPRQIIGNAGLYYVSYRLSLLGWNVVPTARNAAGVDLLLYSADARIQKSLQIKTLSKRDPVPLGGHLDHLFADFVIVVRHIQASPECFVLTPDEVTARVHRGESNGKISYWLQPQAYEVPAFKERWDRLAQESAHEGSMAP